MITITYAEYESMETGAVIPLQEFTALANLAALAVDGITNDALKADLNGADTERVKKAVAYQTAYLFLNGGAEAAVAGGDNVLSEKIGNYTYTAGGNLKASGLPNTRDGISSIAIAVLYPTGLLYRGSCLR